MIGLDTGDGGRGSGVGPPPGPSRGQAQDTGCRHPDTRRPTPDPRSHHPSQTGRISLSRRLASVRHKGISGQERERVLPGRVPAKLADRDSGQAGKDYRGLTIVVVVSEYMQQSCSQSVGNASKSL